MDKNRGSKALILSLFSTLLFSTASAASPWNTEMATDFLVGVAKALTWYEIQTWFDALFFFVTWLSLYFISIKLVQTVWKLIGKRISRGSGGRFSPGLGGEDSPDFYEKGLAATLSLLGTQYIGPALAPIIGVTWGLFGIILALAVWAIFRQFMAGKMPSGSDNGSDEKATDGGTAARNPGQVQSQIDNLNKQLDSIADEINDSGNNGNTDEAEDAAEKMQSVLKQMENVEMELEEMLEADGGDLERAIEEAQEILEAEQQEERDISDIQYRLQRAGEALEMLNEAVDMLGENGTNLPASDLGGGPQGRAIISRVADQLGNNGHNPGVYGTTAWGLKKVWEEDIQGLENDVNELLQIEKKESPEVSDEVQRVEREAKRFTQAYQLIQEVRQLIQEAESEDKALEQIAKKSHDEKLGQEVSVEEKEEGQLEQMLKDLMNKEEMIEQELEKAAGLLEKELKADVQEEQQLQQEIQEEQQLGQLLQDLMRRYNQYYDFDPKNRNAQYIQDMEKELANIEQYTEKIEGLKQSEIQKLREAESAISKALNQ